jgi:hypothetical protein
MSDFNFGKFCVSQGRMAESYVRLLENGLVWNGQPRRMARSKAMPTDLYF